MIRTAERQETAPRLTELEKMGYVEAVKKKYDDLTETNVAVYERTQKGFESINMNHIPII